jgi:DNA-binding NarL/FixJ family response regulator
MYKLVYIDEQPEFIRVMEGAVYASEHIPGATVEGYVPLSTIEETLALIEEARPDALISDFRLNEHMEAIGYTGVDLIAAFTRSRPDFPCFLTTGYPRSAIENAIRGMDVNAIYSKTESLAVDDASDDEGGAGPFLLRVRRKIDAYKDEIQSAENRILELREKLNGGGLKSDEAKELFDLDARVEYLLGANFSIPSDLKARAIDPLLGFLNDAREKIASIEKKYR